MEVDNKIMDSREIGETDLTRTDTISRFHNWVFPKRNKERSRNSAPGNLEARANVSVGLPKSSLHYGSQADNDGHPSNSSTGSSTQNARLTNNDDDSYQSLSGIKSSSPIKFENEDRYRKKYPELAPAILNPNLTANPYPKSTSSADPNANPNPSPVGTETSIPKLKVSPDIGKTDLTGTERVPRFPERHKFDDFIFTDANKDGIKYKVLTG